MYPPAYLGRSKRFPGDSNGKILGGREGPLRILAVELREYYIPDFSNWKDHDAFEAEFGKLLRDLKAEEA